MGRFRLLCLAFLLPHGLCAQWRATVAHGLGSGYHDATDATAGDDAEFRADRLRTWVVGLDRTAGGWRAGLDLRRTVADLAEDGSETAVVARDALSAIEGTLAVAHRVVGHGTTPSLWLGAGLAAERWSFDVDGGSPRWRVAVRLSAEGDVPLTRRWSALVRGEYALGAAAFGQDELPDGFAPATARRAEVQIGAAFTP